MKKNTKLPAMEAETKNPFSKAGEQLAQMEADGLLPEGFDLEAACADREFAVLVQQFPIEAAVRIYDAEQRLKDADKNAVEKVQSDLRRRGSLPKPQRGNGAIAASPNYMAMSSEAFRAFENNLKAAARNGGKIKI